MRLDRVLLILTACAACVAGAMVVRQAAGTLEELSRVELKRDAWQRPADVIAALDLHPGDAVEDLGSGAGYFSLKLARLVGSTGTVRAVELRAESLAFLRIRSRRDHLSAICAIHGDAAGDDVARGAALDAVLISNTWHELVRPESVLRSVWRSLRPGGRLVVLDQGPASAQSETWLEGRDRHEVPSDLVRRALTGQGFEIVSSDDRFIEGGDDHGHWWLVVARKPQAVAATTRD